MWPRPEFVTSRMWSREDTWVSALDSRECMSGTALMHSHYHVEDWLIRRSDVMWYVIDTAALPKQPPHTFLPLQPKSPTHDTASGLHSVPWLRPPAHCTVQTAGRPATFMQRHIIWHAHGNHEISRANTFRNWIVCTGLLCRFWTTKRRINAIKCTVIQCSQLKK
jgi:hypothetical protein